MIIARLYGGLGNQMFQYAAARRLQLLRAAELRLDLGWFDTRAAQRPSRPYALGHLTLDATPASTTDIAAVTAAPARWPAVRLLLDSSRPHGRKRLRCERTPYRYEPDFTDTPDPVYLDGYWQNESYFIAIADILRNEFRVRSPVSPASMRIADTMSAVTAVSVHVRRGDYARQAHTHQHHGLCPIEYYTAACSRIETVVRDPHYFVFSDESDWARDNLSFIKPVTFVSCNDSDHQYEDLHLMTLCRHHVVANSSFSWWGAWLAERPGQVVIAPRSWVAANLPGDQIIPERWMRC
jgi:hypothetical protein